MLACTAGTLAFIKLCIVQSNGSERPTDQTAAAVAAAAAAGRQAHDQAAIGQAAAAAGIAAAAEAAKEAAAAAAAGMEAAAAGQAAAREAAKAAADAVNMPVRYELQVVGDDIKVVDVANKSAGPSSSPTPVAESAKVFEPVSNGKVDVIDASADSKRKTEGKPEASVSITHDSSDKLKSEGKAAATGTAGTKKPQAQQPLNWLMDESPEKVTGRKTYAAAPNMPTNTPVEPIEIAMRGTSDADGEVRVEVMSGQAVEQRKKKEGLSSVALQKGKDSVGSSTMASVSADGKSELTGSTTDGPVEISIDPSLLG